MVKCRHLQALLLSGLIASTVLWMMNAVAMTHGGSASDLTERTPNTREHSEGDWENWVKSRVENNVRDLNTPWDAKIKKTPKGGTHFWYVTNCEGGKRAAVQGYTLDISWETHHNNDDTKLTRLVSGCHRSHKDLPYLNTTVVSKDGFYVYFTPTLLGDTGYTPGNRPQAALYWFLTAALKEDYFVAIDLDFIFAKPYHPPVLDKFSVRAQPYRYLANGKWADTVKEKCRGDDNNGYCNGLAYSKDLGVGVPYSAGRGTWIRILPVWDRLIEPLHESHHRQEDDMIAFAWTLDYLNITVFAENITMTYPGEDLGMSPTFYHYAYPVAPMGHGETIGSPFPSFTSPHDLVHWEHSHHRLFLETVYFSKWGVPYRSLLDCSERALLLEFPPSDFLQISWARERNWFLQHSTVIKAMNAAVLRYKQLRCPKSDLDMDKTLRVWDAPQRDTAPAYRSSYVLHTLEDGTVTFKRAPWTLFKGSKMVFSFVVATYPTHLTSFTGEVSYLILPVGTGVVVSDVRDNKALVSSPYYGWVHMTSLRSNMTDASYTVFRSLL
eukprot:TRINITY_DN14717_c0_g1_i1.p1 TRINITY_DN14717_c0_g1~~TRINITY_DN14717_c0_g1_i1.p1  ORF type:complete len:570 (+),score=76.11 TRINITY_DN14717_c0_g1_i1:56-1711(+)